MDLVEQLERGRAPGQAPVPEREPAVEAMEVTWLVLVACRREGGQEVRFPLAAARPEANLEAEEQALQADPSIA